MVGVDGRAFVINRVTGEAKLLVRSSKGSGTTNGLRIYTAQPTAYGDVGKN